LDTLFRIHFAGLCAFVPTRSGATGDVDVLTVLLVKGSEKDESYCNSEWKHLDHYPRLRCRGADIVTCRDSLLVESENGDDDGPVKTFRLDGLDLRIGILGGSPQLVGHSKPGEAAPPDKAPLVPIKRVDDALHGGPHGSPASANEADDYRWVPEMIALYRDLKGLNVHSDYMGEWTGENEGVVARLILDKGGIWRSEPTFLSHWALDFVKCGGGESVEHNQNVAMTSLLELGATTGGTPEPPPRIAVYAAGEPNDPLVVLKPSFGNTIDVCVENLPTKEPEWERVDYDFELIYKVADVDESTLPRHERLLPRLPFFPTTRARPCSSVIYNTYEIPSGASTKTPDESDQADT
jgi:hypothetical protein